MNTITLNRTATTEDQPLVDLVEEITARLQAGEPCDVDEYADRYPQYAAQLRDWLTVMTAMADLGHSLLSHKGEKTLEYSPPLHANPRAALGCSPPLYGEGCHSGATAGLPSSPAGRGSPDPADLTSSIEHPESSVGLLGDFRILREVGRGGMGVVYEAEQLSLDRRVALKVLPFAAMLDRQQLARFKNEARAAATLDHPNIVAIHSVGVERGVHYYAMQLIEGQSLAQVIDQLKGDCPNFAQQNGTVPLAQSANGNPQSEITSKVCSPPLHGEELGEGCRATIAAATLSTLNSPPASLPAPSSSLPAYSSRDYFRAIANLGIQAAEALDHAHKNGILHRDIKPANLLVECSHLAPRDVSPANTRRSLAHHAERDAYTHLKLWITDFGLARMEQDAGMTMTGDLLGTLRYMSPEQALAKRVVVDHRSDIYSLGVTLYELLTLQPAFPATDRQELLRQIAFDEPRKPRQINPQIPQDLETIILKAIEKNPTDRYATAHQLADDLRRFVDDRPIAAKQPNMWAIARKWSRRNRPLVASAAISAAALVLISLGLLASSNLAITRERNEKTAALDEKAAALQERTTALARSEWNYKKALQAIDQLLARVGNEKLAEVPQLDQLRMDVLKDTLEFYESFIAGNPGDRELHLELAKTHRRVGTMHHDSLRFTAAKWHRGKAIEMLDELHALEPSHPEYRYELAVALFQQGWTLDIPCYPRSIDLFEGLVKEFPDSVTYREGLADALRSYFEEFAPTEIPSIRQSADTDKLRLLVERTFQVAKSPGVFKRFLGHAYIVSGGLAVFESRLDDAEADYRTAIRAYGDAIAARPTDGRTRQHHMRACNGLASFFEERGDDKQAEHWHRKAIALGEELTRDFPTMRLFRKDENECVSDFVNLLKKQSRIDDATEFLGGLAPIAASDFAERARLYSGLGQQELANADYEQAVDRAQQELQTDPTNPSAYESLFDGLMRLGRTEEALDLARNMPTPDVESLAVRAALYRESEGLLTPTDSEVMIELHSQLVEYLPTDVSQLCWRAIAHMKANQIDKALLDAGKAIEAHPTFMLARDVRGSIYLRLGRYDEAVADFTKAIRRVPNVASKWAARGQAYMLAGRDDEALADLNEAIRLDPFVASSFLARAYAYSRQQQNVEALADLDRALSLEPMYVEAINVRGLIYQQMNQFDKAAEAHSEAIRLTPRAPHLFSNRAKAYLGLRRYREAIDDYEAALAIDESYWHARINLAWLLVTADEDEYRDGKRAVELAQKTYDAGNFGNYGEPKFLRILAAARAELGEFEKAIECCQNAIELAKDDNELREELTKHLANYQAGRPWRIGDKMNLTVPDSISSGRSSED